MAIDRWGFRVPEYVALTDVDAAPWAKIAVDRQRCPVAEVDIDGFTYLQVYDYDIIRRILRDHRTFSNEMGVIPRGPEPEGERVLEFADPPAHTVHRKLVAKAFGAAQVDEKTARIQEIADDLVDAIAEKGNTFELRHDFGRPLPSQIVAEILGIPASDRDYFIGITEQAEALVSSETELSSEAARLQQLFLDYVFEQFRIREDAPTDDLLSTILHAEEAGQRFTRLEAAAIVRLILGAGNGTTSIAISNTVRLLEENPTEKAKLLADPDTIAPLAVEEGLRFDCPVLGNFRGVMADAEVGGVQLSAGDRVFALYASANHDPGHYENPDAFIVDRDWSTLPPHFAFGYGIHFCIGAHLARVETAIGLKTLYRRLPNLRMQDGFVPEQLLGMVFRTVKELPMVFDGDPLPRISPAKH
jgi:cytochrome P450